MKKIFSYFRIFSPFILITSLYAASNGLVSIWKLLLCVLGAFIMARLIE